MLYGGDLMKFWDSKTHRLTFFQKSDFVIQHFNHVDRVVGENLEGGRGIGNMGVHVEENI